MFPALLGVLSPVLDKVLSFIPNPVEREKAKLAAESHLRDQELELIKVLQAADKAQTDINIEEAKSSSLFVSGARPFVMWTCGTAFAWTFVLQPFISFFFAAAGHPVTGLPALNLGEMMPVLMGILGLGGLRSFEKVKGVAAK